MRLLFLIIFLLASASHETSSRKNLVHPKSLILFDFDSDEKTRWQVVNDGVMGGRSKGYVSVRDGVLNFKGKLVTRGGGFTSIRSSVDLDLSPYDGIELRVKGGGRDFEIEVDDGTRWGWGSVSRRSSFNTTTDWTLVRIPFNRLRTTVFGRRVSAPAISLKRIEQIGLYIADGKDGPFELEVDFIKAYSDNSK